MSTKGKIVVVLGTRPEAVKLAPLVLELRRREADVTVVSTSQHENLLLPALAAFSLSPDITLQSAHGELFERNAEMISAVGKVISSLSPSLPPSAVVVHGDTQSAHCAAEAAFLLGVRVAHIEAGLRTGDIYSPFPEEYNRRAIDAASYWHFAPTQEAARNIAAEGLDAGRVYVTGNTVVDALRYTIRSDYSHPVLARAGREGKKLLLVTAHRRESVGKGIDAIFGAVRRILMTRDDVIALVPLHPNPGVRASGALLENASNAVICDPLGVTDFHNILKRATLVLTDSGGVCEEASALGVPALVARDRTERGEGVETGSFALCGRNEDAVFASINGLLDNEGARNAMSCAPCPFGDGRACERIADVLLSNAREEPPKQRI